MADDTKLTELIEDTTPATVEDAPATDAPAADAPAVDETVTDAPAVDAPATDAPATDAPAADEANTDEAAKDDGGEIPLDTSADTGASPALEEIAAPEGATAPDADDAAMDAPVEEAPAIDENEAPALPALDAPAEDAPQEDEAKDDAGDAAQENDAPAEEAPAIAGDKGLGATHAGTDTPEVMVSNPCDPVTGKPLKAEGSVGLPPITGGGIVPAISPYGHVVPGAEPIADQGGGVSSGQDGEDEGFEDDGEITKPADFGYIYAQLDAIEERIATLRDALDGYEEI